MSAGAWSNAFEHHWAGPALYVAMAWCVVVWALRHLALRPKLLTIPRRILFAYWAAAGMLFVGQLIRTVWSWGFWT